MAECHAKLLKLPGRAESAKTALAPDKSCSGGHGSYLLVSFFYLPVDHYCHL
jgi:hypothetical protein